MSMKETIEDKFALLAAKVSVATGSFWAFSGALLIIAVWALLGPAFRFSDDWQLVVNTGTTIVTFLMVFVIQHAQNKEMRAVQLKLNELIAALDGASNRLIDVEDLTEQRAHASLPTIPAPCTDGRTTDSRSQDDGRPRLRLMRGEWTEFRCGFPPKSSWH